MPKIVLFICFGFILTGIIVFGYQNKFRTEEKTTPNLPPTKTGSKTLEVLEKYCMEESLKLPQPLFKYNSVEGPSKSGPMPWVNKYYPKNLKQSEKISCTLAYRFDGNTAYNSVSTSYPSEGIKFDRIVYEQFASKIDSSWSLVKEEMNIYSRENPQMGTVDYVDIFDGGLVIFIKFNTYYK